MGRLLCIMTLLALQPRFASAAEPPLELVDLHAHYFMPEAIGFELFGHFDGGPINATTWEDRIDTRVNGDELNSSDVKIAVVAFYSHPFFRGSQRDSLRRQIQALRHFVEKHPEWAIALSASDARNLLAAGKRVFILSIEGALDVIESESDLEEFVDRLGVRIITPIHFMDGPLGGAAFMPGSKIWVNPIAAFKSLFARHYDAKGVVVNPMGLTDKGSQMIEAMIRHGVWIDLSHSSDASFSDIAAHLATHHLPLLFTHTILRGAMRGERAISDEELNEVLASGGIVGLLPSDDMLVGTSPDPRFCPAECGASCDGGVAAFLTQYSDLTHVLPPSHVMIGSDIDAPLTFLKPGCEAAARSRPKGLWEYSQLSELGAELQRFKLTSGWVETFLNAWARVKP